jgi:alpha-tubulin suppressor-like RCC1 family protein
MALLSVGVIMEWGANEYGQLGNKKRAFLENPVIVSNFTKENVVSISCGQNNSAVVIDNRENEAEQK